MFHRSVTCKLPEAEAVPGLKANGQSSRSHVECRALKQFTQDVDLLGTRLAPFAKQMVRGIILVGRAGTLVDWEGENERRAYAVRYEAEQILNWPTERVNERNVVTLVTLKERGKLNLEAGGDESTCQCVELIRVLRLMPVGSPQAAGRNERKHVVEIWQRRGRKMVSFTRATCSVSWRARRSSVQSPPLDFRPPFCRPVWLAFP